MAKKSTHVPGQYLGYSLQADRMVCLLLTAPNGSAVSLEVFDDVGMTLKDGSKVAEQVKSSISSHNPIADFSNDLWKTFSNWLDAVLQGELSVDQTIFEIYIPKSMNGSFATKLSAANDDDSVEKILAEISIAFNSRKLELSSSVINFVETVLNFDRNIVYKLFTRFKLTVGTGDITDELAEILGKNPAIPADIANSVGNNMVGWVKLRTDSLIQNNKPAIIKEEDFRGELQAIIRKLDRGNVLTSFAPNPDPEDIETQKERTYVLQLGIIEVDDAQKLEAINDYLKAAIDRSEWAKKGLVSESSYNELEDDLKRTWKNSQMRVFVSNKVLSDNEKGQLLYAECAGYKPLLQGVQVPASFTMGNFHQLADMLKIGWHPRYEELLPTLESSLSLL